MRDLIVSVAIVAVLIGGWLFFDSYSARSVDEMSDLIYSDLIPAVEAEDWDDSRAMVTELSQAWNEYKKKALFFLNSEELSEIDYCLAKADKYVNAEDVSKVDVYNSAMVWRSFSAKCSCLINHVMI